MKSKPATQTPIVPLSDRARARIVAWSAAGDSNETIAGRVGCSVRSIENWLGGSKISSLSSRVILSAPERSS